MIYMTDCMCRTAEVNRRIATSEVKGDLTLRCGLDHDGLWNCKVEVEKYMRTSRGDFYQFPSKACPLPVFNIQLTINMIIKIIF